MYATFLQQVFNKCFSAIYLIPEKVVQWLGGQSDSFGKEESQQMSQANFQVPLFWYTAISANLFGCWLAVRSYMDCKTPTPQ